MYLRILRLVPLALLVTACSSTSASVDVKPAASPYETAVQEGHAFTMAVMRRGAVTDIITPREMGALTRKHIDFTQELADSRLLLVSGPFVGERVETSLRSVAILDSTDATATHERLCQDPATQEGVLEVETFPFIARSDVRAMPNIERATRGAQGSDVLTLRPYILMEGPTGAEFDTVTSGVEDLVLLRGDCLGGTFEGRTMVVLDCRTVSEAQSLISRGHTLDVRLHPWVSTVALTEMR